MIDEHSRNGDGQGQADTHNPKSGAEAEWEVEKILRHHRESRVRERGRGGGVSDTTSKGFAKAITIMIIFAREM